MAFVISGSAKTGPNIKDVGNLAFYVDASNPKSYDSVNYPDKLFSMVPGGKDAQLYGYPYYTPQDNGGSITFSTASQQRFLIDPVPLTTQSFAVEVWFRAGKGSTGVGYNGILSCGDLWSAAVQSIKGWGMGMTQTTTATHYGVAITSSNGPQNLLLSGPTLTVGQVYNFLLQRNTIDQKIELYVNGLIYGSFSLNNTGSLNGSPNQIQTSTYSYGDLYNNNTYYSMKMYTNTQFTAAEVQQNFNAVRTKFGI
jgi:hypothetical protein